VTLLDSLTRNLGHLVGGFRAHKHPRSLSAEENIEANVQMTFRCGHIPVPELAIVAILVGCAALALGAALEAEVDLLKWTEASRACLLMMCFHDDGVNKRRQQKEQEN
jgi:hypothetical protein